jgi:biopolymer transport protein ExbD
MPDFVEERDFPEEQVNGNSALQEGIFMLGAFLAVSSLLLLIQPPAGDDLKPQIVESPNPGIDLPLVPSEISIRLLDDNRILVNSMFVDSRMIGVRLAELMSFQPGATISIEASPDASINELVKIQNAARRAAGDHAVTVKMQHFEDEVTNRLLK